jgi:hypothetical protein
VFCLGRRCRQASILGLLLVGATSVAKGEGLDGRLLGAWVPSGSECSKIFQGPRRAPVFKQPVDTFTTAFIIGGREVRASTGSCRIGKVSSEKGYTNISLSCDNAGGYLPLSARVKIVSATEITYGDAAVDPLLDALYKKCGP